MCRGCRPLWMHRHAAPSITGKRFRSREMDAKTVYTTRTRLRHPLSFPELARKSDDLERYTPVASAAASIWEMQIIEKVTKIERSIIF